MSTDLTIVQPSVYAGALTACCSDLAEIREVAEQNFSAGVDDVNLSDILRKFRIPAGGTTSWVVGEETQKTVEGIILYIACRRRRWPSSTPTGEPPVCRSDDGLIGIGHPGGKCKVCPFNQFGTSRKTDGSQGRGKECKEGRLLFIMQPDRTLPDVVVLTPGSLGPLYDYLSDLTQRRLRYFAVVTRATLVPDKNKDGIAYAAAKLEAVGLLDNAMIEQLRTMAQGMGELFASVDVDGDFAPAAETQEV